MPAAQILGDPVNDLHRQRLIGRVERRIKKMIKEKADEEMSARAALYLHFDNGAPPRRVVPKKIAEHIIDTLEEELNDARAVGLRVVHGGRA